MIALIEARIALAARRAAYGTAALAMILVGCGFLTAAAWIALARTTDALTAALVIGAVYVGLGLLILGVTSRRRYRVPARGTTAAAAETTPRGDMLPAAVQAFFVGVSAGMSTGRSRGRRRR